MKTGNLVIGGALVLLVVVVSLFARRYMPEQVAIHWDLSGHANGFGPRWMLLVLMPVLMTAVVFISIILPKISPANYSVENFKSTYEYIVLVALAMMGYAQFVLLWANYSSSFDAIRVAMGGFAFFLLLMGNVMGKVRRNFWMGIRTPWALASDAVWYATHRFAAKAIVISALLTLVAVFVGASMLLSILILVLGAISPAAYSFVFYNSLKREGKLS